jgi:hypothetical protein
MEDRQRKQEKQEKLQKLEKAKYNTLKYMSVFVFSMTMLFCEPKSIYAIYQGGGPGAIALIYSLIILMVFVEQILILGVGGNILLGIEDSLNKEGSKIKLWFLHFLGGNKEMNYMWTTLLLYSLRNIIIFPYAVENYATNLLNERGRLDFATVWFIVLFNFPVFCIYTAYFCYGLIRFIVEAAGLGVKNLLIVMKNYDISGDSKEE